VGPNVVASGKFDGAHLGGCSETSVCRSWSPADATVLSVPAEQFIHDVLRGKLGVRVVVVGSNFRFGHRGAGGVLTIRELAAVEGLDGVEVGTVRWRVPRCPPQGFAAALPRGVSSWPGTSWAGRTRSPGHCAVSPR